MLVLTLLAVFLFVFVLCSMAVDVNSWGLIGHFPNWT